MQCVMWAMKAADWHYENDRNVGIVALATNRVFFAGKGPVCGEGIALWVAKAGAV